MEEEVRICDCCGAEIPEGEDYSWIGDDIVCDDCRRDEIMVLKSVSTSSPMEASTTAWKLSLIP